MFIQKTLTRFLLPLNILQQRHFITKPLGFYDYDILNIGCILF